MPDQLVGPLAQVIMEPGYVFALEARDPTSGDPVSGVTVSDVVISGVEVEPGEPQVVVVGTPFYTAGATAEGNGSGGGSASAGAGAGVNLPGVGPGGV